MGCCHRPLIDGEVEPLDANSGCFLIRRAWITCFGNDEKLVSNSRGFQWNRKNLTGLIPIDKIVKCLLAKLFGFAIPPKSGHLGETCIVAPQSLDQTNHEIIMLF